MFMRTLVTLTLLALSWQVAQASQLSTQNKKEKFMGYQIEVVTTQAQPVLVIKGKTSFENAGATIGGAIGKVGQYLGKVSQSPSGAPFARMLEIKQGVLEFEAGFPVAKAVPSKDEIYSTELPLGTMVTTTHEGSQETSELAYKALHAWMAQNKKSEAGAPWEVYLTDETTPADQAKMQIYYPVK